MTINIKNADLALIGLVILALSGSAVFVIETETGEGTVEKANGQVYAKVETSEEFKIHTEELHMFIDFELEYALRKYDNNHYAPCAVLRYLMRLSTVSINKGSHSEYDRMLRMSNQI